MSAPLLEMPYKLAIKLYTVANQDLSAFGHNLNIIPIKEYANDLIYKALLSDQAMMVGSGWYLWQNRISFTKISLE